MTVRAYGDHWSPRAYLVYNAADTLIEDWVGHGL